MSERTQRILKLIGGWSVFFLAAGFLIVTPSLYLFLNSGIWNGRQAVCASDGTKPKTVSLKEVALRADFWTFQPVAVLGKLSYSENRETFYLRDGIFSLPLNVSDCQNIDGFNEVTLAAVKGVVLKDRGELTINVVELRETAPGLIKVIFGAGYLGLNVAVAILILTGIARLLRWVLIAIGLKKPVAPLSPEEAGNKAAGRMLLASFGIPITWFFNPVFGAGLHIFNIIYNRSGLESPKRKVAIVGLILSATGFVLMFMFAFGYGALEDPSKSINFYATTESTPILSTGKELLEIYPYVNNDLYFSIHQPKSWVVDEKKIKTDALLTFEGPEDGVFQGKPFRPKFNVSFIPIAALGARSNEAAVSAFKAAALKNSTLISDEARMLAGGRLEANILEAIETHEEGYNRHVLALVVAENDILYIAGAAIPEEKWNDSYAQLIRASFKTFQAWRATFAACLNSKGSVFYSVFDCEYCDEQKVLFTEGIERLPYVECQNGMDDTSQADVCRDKKITGYPTWEFADGSQLVGVQTLKALSGKTGCVIPR